MSPREIASDYFSPDIREFLLLLHQHSVQYLIVGGEAVILYGHARLTGDVDIFYQMSDVNLQNLYRALLEFWDGEIPGIENSADFRSGEILQFGVPPNRLDLINRIDGVTFDEAWRDRFTVMMKTANEPIALEYIGIDTLIQNKQASGRAKDLSDLEFLRNRP